MTYKEPVIPTSAEVVFHGIRRIIEDHQKWWYEKDGEYVISDTWPTARAIMDLVLRHYQEISLRTEE